jgi:Ni,Fe-hydrogenase III large subunit/Ni,Fe-hydrogenase III component G
MVLRAWFDQASRQLPPHGGIVPGAPHTHALTVTREEWRTVAENVAAAGGRLLSLWASPEFDLDPRVRGDDGQFVVRAAYVADPGVLIVSLPLAASDSQYPGIELVFPSAVRMQRAVTDLCGLRSTQQDQRPWLRHASWPADFYPLADSSSPAAPPAPDNYRFVQVAGEGVHEIPVGPVHAGIIEPGHFRFSIVGEKVLRLEERLGYVHKGIERRFTELPILSGHRLAARVSGDSAVAYSWAYCQALEGMSATAVPPRAIGLRALALELERIANHVGDLGALGNDAGFAFGLSQFSRLKEHLLRAIEQAFGQRYLMDLIVPGGTSADLSSSVGPMLAETVARIAAEVQELRAIYDEHSGVRERFTGAGIVKPELAAKLGLTGLAGRASGQAFDLRCDLPWAPYHELAPAKAVREEGDVAARVAVRFDEVAESARLVARMIRDLPAGAHHTVPSIPPDGAFGVGLIEGWRGPVFVALEAGAAGAIRRCHPHDPSWQNWPVLEHAILDNIVPDFPLINKSFNLSYSGHDL